MGLCPYCRQPADSASHGCRYAGRQGEFHPAIPSRPMVVCLCGSTRFYEAFQRANCEETIAGRIVLSVGFYPHSSERAHGQSVGCDDEQKKALDRLHLRKIDMADEVLVLNVGGYIGESTRREILHAVGTGKAVRYLEPGGLARMDAADRIGRPAA
jgi:hypothetical protein